MRVTLVAEGSSDQALVPIVQWTLREVGVQSDLETSMADWSRLPKSPNGLAEKIRIATELFPCDLLIVHRDSDNSGSEARRLEIARAVGPLQITVPHVPLVPIRMSEAWLLFNEQALRSAAGNPYSRCALDLPTMQELERMADPKEVLFERLRVASELTGRRLRRFDRNRARAQITEFIDDFSPLRGLEAFCMFEEDLRTVVPLLAE